MQYPFDQGQQQTWTQVGQLLVATALSSIIGIEREWRHKSAGLRTNTLVGVGAALFMLISKLGTLDVLDRSLVVLDPSRIAAQIVSGIGFIGGGIIFRQRNEVRGLTTAAGVWLSAAVGAACGAGLLRLATVSTGLYFVAVLVYPNLLHFLQRRFKSSEDTRISAVVRYQAGANGLETVLQSLMEAGFLVHGIDRLEEVPHDDERSGAAIWNDRQQLSTDFAQTEARPSALSGKSSRIFNVHVTLGGNGVVTDLMRMLSQLDCVISITPDDGQHNGMCSDRLAV
ncbi:Mg2+ transporter MgtC family protein [Aspergillus alliaceus]|uniref:Mg2+ transporter MgtC family protein n=1 Tax=Petromyces alliaceus TaxID=209559 RepID=A0A5N7CNG9_PETAA|nr:Mg2+ transporter MgtC family protein [Aspergillus alliaceus]